jgi:membrane protease YdiL (CAAX protease family)
MKTINTNTASISPWLLLPMRLILFALFQGLIALIAPGSFSESWATSIVWWPVGIVLANLVTIIVMRKLFAAEGMSYCNLFRIERSQFRSDWLPLLGILLFMAILAVVPNMLFAQILFENPEAVPELFIKTLPFGAASILLIAFPVTIALAEMPLYFGYIMPRLERSTKKAWLAIVLVAFFAAAQHMTMPLIFDWHFIIWRLIMFIPFVLFLAIVIRWRPRLLPYIVITHGLLDASLIALMF